MKELAIYSASVMIGLCLGMIGAGGSILTIPVLVYLLKTDPIASTIYSMFIVGICSFVGCVLAFAKRLVDIKAALLFGVPSIAGVFISRKLIFPVLPDNLFSIGTFNVSKEVAVMISLAVIMIFVSLKMFGRKKEITSSQSNAHSTTISFVMRGLITGIVTGFLGVGGGFLIVPALILWLKLPIEKAVGTTLLIITVNSIAGFISSYASMQINWSLLIKFSVGAITGIISGTYFSEKIKAENLRKILAWFIMITSTYILYSQFHHCIEINYLH